MANSIYGYHKENDIPSDFYPQNTHLAWEDSVYGIYFVRHDNNKILEKSTDKMTTTETVTTRTNKNIARGWHDKINHIIYLVDCEYDDTISYIWKIDLSDDSIEEFESIPSDVFDIWRFQNETYISYFGSGGYTLESETVYPVGDASVEWDVAPGGTHWSVLDDEAETGDWIQADYAETKIDQLDVDIVDVSVYDSGEVYEITVMVYARQTTGSSMQIKLNVTGATTYKTCNVQYGWSWRSVTFSGLSLNQEDLDDLDVYLRYVQTGAGGTACLVASCKVTVRFYGNEQVHLNIKNLDTSVTQSNNMGVIGERTWNMSQMTIVGTDFHFNWQWSDETVKHFRFQTGIIVLTN